MRITSEFEQEFVASLVMSASQALNSACSLSAQTDGGTSCVSGLRFQLLGVMLTATGAASMIITLLTSIRGTPQVATVAVDDYDFAPTRGRFTARSSVKRGHLRHLALCALTYYCLLYTSPSPRDRQKSRMPSS